MNAGEKEFLRHAVLEVLASRHPAALPVSGIVRRLRTEVDFAVDEVEVVAALTLLLDLGLVRSQWDTLGASTWWAVTAEGVLKVERGGK